MRACGADRPRILTVLIAFVGLFAAPGCAVSGGMPAPGSFASAAAQISETPAPDTASRNDDWAPPSAEIGGAADSVTSSGWEPRPRLVAVAEETHLSTTSRTAANPLFIRASALPSDWSNRPSGLRASVEAFRRHVATLQFARGSASLAREEYAILRAIAALRARQGGRVEVIGHADGSGARGMTARRVSQPIAERRALAVADGLFALGLPRAAITAEGRGNTQPRYLETNVAGAAGNRRVEIYLLSADSSGVSAQEYAEPGPIREAAAEPGADSAAVALQESSAEASEPAPTEGVVTGPQPAASQAASPAEATADGAGISQRVRVATLYFPHASRRLGRRERAIIKAAAVFGRQRQGTFAVVGHASAAGASSQNSDRLDQANRSISLARADAVAKALAAEGIAADQMSVTGRGADAPAFAEDDAAGEAGNRRVEIYVDLPAAVRLADRGQGLPR